MRTNGTLSFILGDHPSTTLRTSLGSTSLVTDATGTMISEMRYKAWGEIRYSSGTTPTQYQYTGQYSHEFEFGLYFYNARWLRSVPVTKCRGYDPSLSRFAQADTIVPTSTQGTQAWDRYAFVNNNPVRYTDPSGHCIRCWVIGTSLVIGGSFILSAVGVTPDYMGIATTMALTDTNDAVLAAGLAVQSQYPWTIIGGSGKGLAQLTSAEMEEFGLEGQNPYSPSVAVAGMETRIQNALKECTSCTTGYDRLIVAAIAQNGSVQGLASFGDLPVNRQTNTIDWNTFLTNPEIGNSSSSLAQLRAGFRNEQYATLFMLRLYIQDLRVLMKLGYQLPDGITEKDVKYVENNFLNRNRDNRR
jgi:RHS repeat-associated protein